MPMDRVDLKAHLTAHIQEVARDRDPLFSPMGHLYVQTYIEGQLSQWGEVEREEFDYSGQSYCNLYLDLPAQTDARRLKAQTSEPTPFQRPLSQRPLFQRPAILIGAHYDAVHGSPGADDNATGVAALLELARSFAAVPAPYPIRLAAFDLEEYGRIGSLVSAQLAAEDGRALRLMISLEMLGYCTQAAHSQTYPAPLDRIYPSTGNFIALIGNLRTFPDLLAWQRRLKAGGTPCVILPIWNRGHSVPRTRDSDHSAFWDQGYNAIMVTDTANLRNPHYHRGSDRPETLDLDFLTRLTQGLIDCLRNL